MKVKDLVNRFLYRRFAVYYNDLLIAVFDDVDDLKYYQKQILDFEVEYFRYYDGCPIEIAVKGVTDLKKENEDLKKENEELKKEIEYLKSESESQYDFIDTLYDTIGIE